jgi:P27 family predicted phage terminase small subunit
MGTRGPLPKPSAVKRLMGTFRADRARGEAHVATSVPSCPKWMSAAAKAEWRRLVPLLRDAGLLTRLDRGVLASYCTAWARLEEAERHIAEDGAVIRTPNGYEQKSAWAGIASESAKLVERFGAHLGLSPASRARVPAQEPSRDAGPNKWAGILDLDDEGLTPLQRLRAKRERLRERYGS